MNKSFFTQKECHGHFFILLSVITVGRCPLITSEISAGEHKYVPKDVSINTLEMKNEGQDAGFRDGHGHSS